MNIKDLLKVGPENKSDTRFKLLVLFGLQTKAQINYCDSISYTTTSTLNYPLIVSGIANIPGVVTWNWTVCNTNL